LKGSWREFLPEEQKSVKIPVKRLREMVPPNPVDDLTLHKNDSAYIPPVLSTNKSSPADLNGMSSPSDLDESREHSTCQSHIKNIILFMISIFFSNFKDKPNDVSVPEVPLDKTDESNRAKENDIFISQYTMGQKDVLRAVLKQKVQHSPTFKEVKVQLLEDASTIKDPVSVEMRSSSSGIDSASTVAAATAAAIATAAPLIKVQSDLEAKVNSVSELLNKLQETDKQLRCVAEQQKNIKAQTERSCCQDHKNQFDVIIGHHLRHLEKIQQQQLDIQNHLITSALNPGRFQSFNMPSSNPVEKSFVKSELRPLSSNHSSHHRHTELPSQGKCYSLKQVEDLGYDKQKSPLETPAPRKFAPIPLSKDDKISKSIRPGEQKESLQILSRKEDIFFSSSVGATLKSKSFPSYEEFGMAEKTTQHIDDIFCGLGQRKREVNDISCPEESLSTFGVTDLPQSPGRSKSTKTAKSILKEAEKILRGVQNNKKVLEENLEAIIHAKDGAAMYSFINALATNRDMLEKFRIRKTVGKWIEIITQEIQVGHLKTTSVVQGSEYLLQVYGKPVYQGHRSTLKKGPYLRFTSPSSKSRPQRPKVIEQVKGTKIRSTKTQTESETTRSVGTDPRKLRSFSPPSQQEQQYLFSPSQEAPFVSGTLQGHLIPMAILLGQTQSNSDSMPPAEVIMEKPNLVTVSTSIPPSIQTKRTGPKKPNTAVIEMTSEKKDPPQLTIQVLPNLDIDSLSSENIDGNQASTSSIKASPPIQTWIQVASRNPEEEKNDDIPEFFESVLEFNQSAKVPSQNYNGPPFPPVVSAAQPTADILEKVIERKEALENSLINWMEQEIMSRIITRVLPFQQQAVPNDSVSESEESEAVAPDVGGTRFQLVVDTGVPVNSDTISHFVNEALEEIIAIMLGNREMTKDIPPIPENVTANVTYLPTVHRTPVPTPQPTPPQSPPPSPLKGPLLIKTPESSPCNSEHDDIFAVKEQFTQTGNDNLPASTLITTPTVTPAATPPLAGTPTLTVSEDSSEKLRKASPKLPKPWSNDDLPLDEENPNPVQEEPLPSRAIVMSVARDEEPENLVLPAPSVVSNPVILKSFPVEAQTPSPVHTPSSVQTTQESSSSYITTETETFERPISEGEILFSYGQKVATRDGGLFLTNFNDSLSSTLRDAHEMEDDSPSEGQVMMKRPHKGHQQDIFLSLLAKLSQEPGDSQQVVYHSEVIFNFSEGQRPGIPAAKENIFMKHYMDQPKVISTESLDLTSFHGSLPKQFDKTTGKVNEDSCASHGPMSLGELDLQHISNLPLQSTQENEIKLAVAPEDLAQVKQKQYQEVQPIERKPIQARVIRVKNKSETSFSHARGGEAVPHLTSQATLAKMSVTLPSVNVDDHSRSQSISTIQGDADSSGADTF
uniref:KIAA0586 n=1 Tax=Monodelphis domestica TaxID=13616 RepID=F7GFU8_MONDO